MSIVRTTLFTLVIAGSLAACDDASKKQPAASVGSASPPPRRRRPAPIQGYLRGKGMRVDRKRDDAEG